MDAMRLEKSPRSFAAACDKDSRQPNGAGRICELIGWKALTRYDRRNTRPEDGCQLQGRREPKAVAVDHL